MSRKRQRINDNQPAEELFQNQDYESELIPAQKGAIFEEECQEELRKHNIACTLSKASKWQKRDRANQKRKFTTIVSNPNQDFELVIQGDHGIDAWGSYNGKNFIAQFKNHKKPIGPSAIRDFRGTLSEYQGAIGIFISKNGFTDNAILELEMTKQPIIYGDSIPDNIKQLLKEKIPLSTEQRIYNFLPNGGKVTILPNGTKEISGLIEIKEQIFS